MLVDNILLCNIYSPTKWKSIYCVYFKKHIKAVLIDRTNQLLGDGFIHKALGSQRNTCWSPFGDFYYGWKSMQQPTLSYQWDWWMSPVLSGTFGSDGLQSRGQPLLLLSWSLLCLAALQVLFLEVFQSYPGFITSWSFQWSITFTTVLSTHLTPLTSAFPLSLLQFMDAE